MDPEPTRAERLYQALSANVGKLFVQRQLLRAAEVTADELFAMDVMAASVRVDGDHAEDVIGGQSVCGVCGELDDDGAEADLYYHPVAALRVGIGVEED